MNPNITPHRTAQTPVAVVGDPMHYDESLLSTLHGSRLTESLRDFEINILASLINVRRFEPQELTAQLDDDSLKDALMILVEGKIEVSAIVDNEPMTLNLDMPGDLARVISFVGGNMMAVRTSMTVRKPSIVMLLQRSKLETLLHSHPGIVYCVMRNLVRHVHGVARRNNADREELSNYFYRMHGRY
jgi:CRP-like cAMP-binding protein